MLNLFRNRKNERDPKSTHPSITPELPAQKPTGLGHDYPYSDFARDILSHHTDDSLESAAFWEHIGLSPQNLIHIAQQHSRNNGYNTPFDWLQSTTSYRQPKMSELQCALLLVATRKLQLITVPTETKQYLR